jgi:hypothetical protein
MSYFLKFTLSGDPTFKERMRTLGPRVIDVLSTKLNGLMFQLSSFIVSTKLSGQILHRKTGALAGSVRVSSPAMLVGGVIKGTVSAGGPPLYARALESGSRGHQIFATKARALSFMTHGKRVFAKSVSHPGNIAYQYMRLSAKQAGDEIRVALEDAVNREIGK